MGLAQDRREANALRTISAAALQREELEPVTFVVEGLIPRGLSLLAAPPKYGKSWLMIDLCLCVADGRPFLGYRTNRTGCLYLALEDSASRLKSRMERVLDGRPAPENFDFCTAAHTLDTGLQEELDWYLTGHPGTGLVVVDTLQRVRGTPKGGREGTYAADYRELGALKQFADGHGVALVLVHHLRKLAAEGDPFDRISGTNGVFGAADTAIVLTREKRSDAATTLTATGRDIEPIEQVIQFNKATCRWENLGGAEWFSEQQAREAYNASPIVRRVKELVAESPNGAWTGSAAQFLETTGLTMTPQKLAKTLREYDMALLDDGITHGLRTNGSGGKKHYFAYLCNAADTSCNDLSNVFSSFL